MQPDRISKLTLQRLPVYLNYLRRLPEGLYPHISATAIAAGLGLGEVQVRKDLAAVTRCGKPKTGYPLGRLIHDLERFLWAGGCSRTVLVGVGNLGLALSLLSNAALYNQEAKHLVLQFLKTSMNG